MNREKLLEYALEKLARAGRLEIKKIVKIVEDLIDDPEGELEKIKIDLSEELARRKLGQTTYRAKLDSDADALEALDVSDIAKKPK